VQAEGLHAEVARADKGVEELVAGEAVLGFLGMADDGVAGLEGAGIVAEAEGVGEGAGGRGQGVDQGDVVEIDDGAEAAGLAEFVVGGLVGGEDDPVAGQAGGLAEAELGEAGAVGAEAFGGEDLQQKGVGGGLDGEMLAEAGQDGKRLGEPPGVVADGRFVVKMERGGEVLREGFGLFAGEGEGLH